MKILSLTAASSFSATGAAILAASVMAATGGNKKTWSGDMVTIGSKSVTPSASTDWSIDNDSGEMTVTYQTVATISLSGSSS